MIRKFHIKLNKTTLIVLFFMHLFILSGNAHAAVNYNSAFNDKYDHNALSSYPYYECFAKAAQKYNVPILLLMSVAKGESNFNPRAVSNKDAVGLMQILWPITARDIDEKEKDIRIKKKRDLYDPCLNINAGASYLRRMLRKYKGDIYLALCAYYAGPGRIRQNYVPCYADDYANYIYSKLMSIQGTSFKRRIFCNINPTTSVKGFLPT